jgi:GrpB-like predicted nucleotidyltransferase (UPF0157 family)
MLGLKRGMVALFLHEKEWEFEAQRTIEKLKNICGDAIVDVAHVGSTSVKTIMAKPIVDIAVVTDNFDEFLKYEKELLKNGFYYRPDCDMDGKQLLFACGSFYDGTGDEQTHFVHVVKNGSMEWINYNLFRDYLNENETVAKEYEALKLSLAEKYPEDNGREKYLAGKHDFIRSTLRTALVKFYLGKTVEIEIDRPIGTPHPKHPEIIYPINYGYIPNVYGGDGEELDVYILGIDERIEEGDRTVAKIIGIVYRKNDVEDKLVAAPEGMEYTPEQIEKIIHFQEQFYDSHVEMTK